MGGRGRERNERGEEGAQGLQVCVCVSECEKDTPIQHPPLPGLLLIVDSARSHSANIPTDIGVVSENDLHRDLFPRDCLDDLEIATEYLNFGKGNFGKYIYVYVYR